MSKQSGNNDFNKRGTSDAEVHRPVGPISGCEEEFTRLVKFLEKELVHTRLKWRVYRAFYDTNKERVELLNSVSGTTARIIQDALYDDVILSLCRSADPATSVGKSNNSFASLLGLLDSATFNLDLSTRIKQLQDLCQPLRNRRNWHVAHSDSQAVFSGDEMGLVSKREVNEVIEAARSTLVFIYSEIFDMRISTEIVSDYGADEIAFLRTLYHGRMQISHLEAEAMAVFSRPANPRRAPPEIDALRELHEKPEWLNYRPADRQD